MKVCILGESRFVPVRHLVEYLVARGDEVHAAGFGPLAFDGRIATHPLETGSKVSVFLARPAVRDLIRKLRPDIVHAFYLTSYGFLSSRVQGTPVLATAMGSDVFGAPDLSRWLRPLRDRLTRAAIERADRIHSVADHMTEQLVRMGAAPSKIVTFPRGVETQRFRTVRDEGDTTETLRATCTRKLEPVYDHRTLLEGASRFVSRGGELRLSLVGEGYLRPALELRAAELGLGDVVRFEGERPHDAMPDSYRQAQVYASASLSDGTSSCLLEAMAAGCIPVVTDIQANRAWVEDGVNGFLFAAGDPDALASALARARETRTRWPDMRRKSLEIVERRGSLAAGLQRVRDLYDELAGRGTV